MNRLDLAKLRDMANRLLDDIDVELVRDEIKGFDAKFTSPTAEPRIAVLQAFLTMTDPTPLNVLQAQSLGLEQSDENEHEYVDADNPTSMLAVMMGRDHTAVSLNVGDPTRGQLLLALSLEDGR